MKGTEIMRSKILINPCRKRRIPRHFSWVDHRLVRENYLKHCSTDALALYLFLVTVGDHEGLSYYSTAGIEKYLNVNSQRTIGSCRRELIKSGLIAYLDGLYQVLDLGNHDSSHAMFYDTVKHGTADKTPLSSENTCSESAGAVIDRILGGK